MKLVKATNLKAGNSFRLSDNLIAPTKRVMETQEEKDKLRIVTTEGDHLHILKTDLIWIGN